MTRTTWMAAVCGLVLMSACAAEEPTGDKVDDLQSSTANVEGQVFIDGKEVDWRSVIGSTESLKSEAAVTDEHDLAAGCVYIQYCNAPGATWGTVGKGNGCPSLEAALTEFFDDAEYVCGGVIPRWRLDCTNCRL